MDEDELEDALRQGIVNGKEAALARKTAGKLLSSIRSGRFRYFTLSLKHRTSLLDRTGELSES
ncbi:hypothetical protein D3C77_704380 [compost metagenome]